MDESNIIALKDVESSYKTKWQEQHYLKSINLSVPAGKVIAIIGRSGAGKSALLRCIGLIERPLTGIVSIDNKNLTFMASKELAAERRMVGFITAKPDLIHTRTVIQNVALPLQIQAKTLIEITKLTEHALIKVGLDAKANYYPSSLTAVQKIQLDIARNLVNNPKILLCDDVFTGLDQKSTETLVNLLRLLQQEQRLTIIISTNDAEIIKTMCQQAIVMHQGKIVEQCSVLDLMVKPSSEVAKEFLRFTTKLELPSSLRKKIVTQELPEHHAIVRVSFIECLAPEEILSNTIDAYDLKMNIIQAYQEKIDGQLVNFMLIEIYGASNIINQAVNFLSTNTLPSEIIGYAPNIN
jgi:D-methionine transport system ATP-binding protein